MRNDRESHGKGEHQQTDRHIHNGGKIVLESMKETVEYFEKRVLLFLMVSGDRGRASRRRLFEEG
jgi:hypothetical protein